MRILVLGNVKPIYFYGKCISCGTIFQAEAKEVYDQFNPTGIKLSDCPVCNVGTQMNTFDESKKMLYDNNISIGDESYTV